MTLTVSAKGWVVIPAEIRKKYGLTPGKKVRIVEYGGGFSMFPVPDNPIAAAEGMLAGGPSLTKELIEEHRREVEADEADFAKYRAG